MGILNIHACIINAGRSVKSTGEGRAAQVRTCRRGSPDGDLGGLGQSHGALEARVDLPHLHGSFQADHL